MVIRVDFAVPFVRGKGRVRFVRATGRSYTPDSTAMAMEQVRMAYEKAADGAAAPKGAPVCVRIVTSRPLPKSRPKKVRRERDVFKPDVDNVAKLVLDALNGVAWVDDTQVVELNVVKLCRSRELVAEETKVTVTWAEDEPAQPESRQTSFDIQEGTINEQ